MTIPVNEWKWDGHPGHLIVAYNCHFWLHTRVGNYRISTIGEWQPTEKGKDEEIGAGRLFETFVFETNDAGEVDSYSEVDSDAYNDHDAATVGHMAMCRKYARLVVRA